MNRKIFPARDKGAGLLFLLLFLTGSCKTCDCPAYTSRKAAPGSQLEQPAGTYPEISKAVTPVAEHGQALPVQEENVKP